jgi:hypothetical protein
MPLRLGLIAAIAGTAACDIPCTRRVWAAEACRITTGFFVLENCLP